MNRHLLRLKHTLLIAATILCFNISAQTTNFNDALAYNETTVNHDENEKKVSNILSSTSINDVSVSNYFQLKGNVIHPYMVVENAKTSYEPVVVSENTISIQFDDEYITYKKADKTYSFKVNNIEQYVNTSDKCLIRAKIEVNCNTVKMEGEKVDKISVFIDQNNHISFIELGDNELYLRP
ncbi:MAG: hypothetical protein H7Y00_06740 [Fimbriimonadaceae bacterium]|nr:hypothetical protein [Chitinophagales bacterium]